MPSVTCGISLHAIAEAKRPASFFFFLKANTCGYNSFDLTSSPVYENNGYSLIGGHMRRLYDNR